MTLETKTKHVSVKAIGRVLKSIPTKFHEDVSCSRLKGAETMEISEEEIKKHGKYITACAVCCSPATQHRHRKGNGGHNLASAVAHTAAARARVFPHKTVVTVWTCSDGREFSNETEALWYELSLRDKKG